MAAPTTTVRIDPELKRRSSEIFEEVGITLSSAVNAFLKAVVREGGIPFEMKADPARPRRTSGNAALNKAFTAKRDEFYTQYEDVAKEMLNYPEKFRGKSVLCNCDDPFESAFFRYFLLHFDELGLSTLTSVCYAGSPVAGMEYPLEGAPGAYCATVTEVPGDSLELPDGALDLQAVFGMKGNSLTRLTGDGDFRSDECMALLEAADIVATNPPFSLFRDFIGQLEKHGKEFVILGNMNAATCKEVFPMFRDNRVWYGESIRSGDRKFHVPDDYPLKAASCGVDEGGRRYIRVKGVRWFTNLDNGRRHEPLELTRTYGPNLYPKYDNYSAIEVSRVSDIPADYEGVMGVPITYLDRYNPQQFEILMLANGNARTNTPVEVLRRVGYHPHPDDKGGVGIVCGARAYARLLIRRRDA